MKIFSQIAKKKKRDNLGVQDDKIYKNIYLEREREIMTTKSPTLGAIGWCGYVSRPVWNIYEINKKIE